MTLETYDFQGSNFSAFSEKQRRDQPVSCFDRHGFPKVMELLLKGEPVNVGWQVKPMFWTERCEHTRTHRFLQLLAPNEGLAIWKRCLSPLQSRAGALFSGTFPPDPTSGCWGPPAAAGPGTIALVPLRGDSLPLHKPLPGCGSQFFQLRNGTKNLLLPRGASRLGAESCYSYPNALNRLQGEKRLKSRDRCHRRDRDGAGDVLQRQSLAPSLPDTTSLLQGKLIMALNAGLGKGINLQDLRD